MATCYGLDGEPSAQYYACNQTAVLAGQHTQCCKDKENCFTNGVCRHASEGSKSNYFWIEGCTDKTFKDPACAIWDSCRNRGDSLVWKCPDSGKWCCNNGGAAPLNERSGHVNFTCCDMKEFMFDAADPVAFTTAGSFEVSILTSIIKSPEPSASSTPSHSANSTSFGGTTSNTPSSQPTPSDLAAPSSKHSSISTGAAVGIGIGLGIAVILMIAGIMMIMKRKSKQNVAIEQQTRAELSAMKPHVEMDGSTPPVEVSSEKMHYELDG